MFKRPQFFISELLEDLVGILVIRKTEYSMMAPFTGGCFDQTQNKYCHLQPIQFTAKSRFDFPNRSLDKTLRVSDSQLLNYKLLWLFMRKMPFLKPKISWWTEERLRGKHRQKSVWKKKPMSPIWNSYLSKSQIYGFFKKIKFKSRIFSRCHLDDGPWDSNQPVRKYKIHF